MFGARNAPANAKTKERRPAKEAGGQILARRQDEAKRKKRLMPPQNEAPFFRCPSPEKAL